MQDKQEIKEELNNVTYWVGKLMRENYSYRLHRNRDDLISHIKEEFNINCSTESITRCQRDLWERALIALKDGDYEFANGLLPIEKEDFEEWLKIRHIYSEAYMDYFGKGVVTRWKTIRKE